MRIIQGTKRILKPLVDFPTWMGYRTIVDNGKSVIQNLKSIFTPRKPKHTESFEQAISRLGLTEKDIKSREKMFLLLSLFWGLVAIGILIHAGSLFFNHGVKGGLLALALTFFALTLCFRYHFWYFQVKNRLLGADFKTWLNKSLGIKE